MPALKAENEGLSAAAFHLSDCSRVALRDRKLRSGVQLGPEELKGFRRVSTWRGHEAAEGAVGRSGDLGQACLVGSAWGYVCQVLTQAG